MMRIPSTAVAFLLPPLRRTGPPGWRTRNAAMKGSSRHERHLFYFLIFSVDTFFFVQCAGLDSGRLVCWRYLPRAPQISPQGRQACLFVPLPFAERRARVARRRCCACRCSCGASQRASWCSIFLSPKLLGSGGAAGAVPSECFGSPRGVQLAAGKRSA
jgi:hypothetical protein